MDTLGSIGFENSIKGLAEAVRELSKHVQELQQGTSEESEKLIRYKEEGILLEFILVTSGLIKGRILWVGNQSFGIRTDSGQDVILYKHAIAIIQEQAD